MKYLSLIVFSFIVTCGYAQKNFAPLGAEWQYEALIFTEACSSIKYEVRDTTTLLGKQCSIISSYYQGRDTGDAKSELIVYEENGKVYFLHQDEFYLLFDFNAEQGDTVHSYEPIPQELFSQDQNIGLYNAPKYNPYLIDSIEQILIDNVPRKLFQTNSRLDTNFSSLCIDRGRIIENIGSRNNFLTGFECSIVLPEMDCPFGIGLKCYRDKEFSYQTGDLPCDYILDNDELNTLDIRIFPNPISSQIIIQGENLNQHNILIIDMYGQVLYQNEFTHSINASTFTPGIYHLIITNEDNKAISVERLVKL